MSHKTVDSGRRVAEEALGKPLPAGAEVHHVNCNPWDNRPQNLVICQNRAYHRLLHRRMKEVGFKVARPPISTLMLNRLNPDVLRQAKARAKFEGRRLKWIVEVALEQYVKHGLKELP